MVEKNGYPASVEGLAYRLDHSGCLYCNSVRNEVLEVKRDVERLQSSIAKAVWLVVGAVVVSALGLINTAITALAKAGP